MKLTFRHHELFAHAPQDAALEISSNLLPERKQDVIVMANLFQASPERP